MNMNIPGQDNNLKFKFLCSDRNFLWQTQDQSQLTVETIPLRTPTIVVVVKAELTIVHKNMLKLRTMPITNARIRITKNEKE